MAAIKILLVDDNKDRTNFFDPLADLADNLLKVELVQAYTFDEMKLIFEESPYEYQAVILDGKGQKTDKSKTEDDAFLNSALKWLQSKNREGIYIPYVIYSGYADELKKIFDDESIYWKAKNEEEKMFADLKNKIHSGDYFNQSSLFPDLYELFELRLLHSKYKPDFVKATQLISDTYTGNIEDVLRSLRPILESTLYTLDSFDNTLLSTACFKRDKIELADTLFYLAGSPKPVGDEVIFGSNEIIPLHIFYLSEIIRKITNSAAMHHYDDSSSRYLVKSCIYALIEYLLWYKKFAKLKNYI
jgi:hypothetical protein